MKCFSVIKCITFALVLVLAVGCAKQNVPTEQQQPKMRAAVVTDVGGIGDMSFNANSWAGLQRAGKDLAMDVKFLESKEQADYATNLSTFAKQGYHLVFAVGFLMEDAVKEVAPKYPKTIFAIIDGNAPKLPNTISLKFRENEGCFLAGALAGAMTKTNTVGFIGGMEVDLIRKFEVSYQAGAMTTNPKVKVLAAYTGRFDDPGKGTELAMAQFGQGADIIMHASGSCGLGVIKAAETKGKGYYAIGVDADQDYLAKGRVLTSMMKRVDNAVYMTCESVEKGTFKPGECIIGLKEGGIGLSPMKYTKQDIPPQVLARIEKLKQKIIAGELIPPSTVKELKAFNAPKN